MQACTHVRGPPIKHPLEFRLRYSVAFLGQYEEHFFGIDAFGVCVFGYIAKIFIKALLSNAFLRIDGMDSCHYIGLTACLGF